MSKTCFALSVSTTSTSVYRKQGIFYACRDWLIICLRTVHGRSLTQCCKVYNRFIGRETHEQTTRKTGITVLQWEAWSGPTFLMAMERQHTVNMFLAFCSMGHQIRYPSHTYDLSATGRLNDEPDLLLDEASITSHNTCSLTESRAHLLGLSWRWRGSLSQWWTQQCWPGLYSG